MRRLLAAACCCFLFSSLVAQKPIPSGYQGIALEEGSFIKAPFVKVVFVLEKTDISKQVATDENGAYRIDLKPGRYYVTATHPDFETYTTAPGFFVVTGKGYQTGNLFMTRKVFPMPPTTILVLRHAEAGAGDDPGLTAAGEARAEDLAHIALQAGVSAIYATQWKRTQETAQPLAAKLRKVIVIKNDMDVEGLAGEILSQHKGQTVLVVGHQPTVPMIIRELGGKLVSPVEGHDDLYIVTVYAPGKAHVLHLQYGAGARIL
ncbi:MAG: histidine phosphatase family protein [Haliscomenobacter sp.]|nr:histidine phosphatase family protein [Haliscomenobacter sp.]